MAIAYSTSNAAGINTAIAVTPSTSGYAQDVTGIAPVMPLGTVAWGTDGSAWFQCVVGVGGVTGLGYVVTIDENWVATMATTSNDEFGDPVGVAPVAALEGDYIWVQRFGVVDAIQAETSALANNPVAATGDAGQIDDAGAVGTLFIRGMILTTARGGTDGPAPGFLNWPVFDTMPNITPA